MSNLYYINPDTSKNPKNNNEVHELGCDKMPDEKEYLGLFDSDIDAVEYAKENNWLDADGCATCCPDAHEE